MYTSDLHSDMFCYKKTKNLIPLFTLGSIFSAKASGAEQIPETNDSNES